jgi:hypothetical protein
MPAPTIAPTPTNSADLAVIDPLPLSPLLVMSDSS